MPEAEPATRTPVGSQERSLCGFGRTSRGCARVIRPAAKRADIGLALLIAVLALLLAPGRGIVALAALLVLAISICSILLERRRSRGR